MRIFFLILVASQVGFLQASDDFFIEDQDTFSFRAEMIATNNSTEDISKLVSSVCYASYQAHKSEIDQNIRLVQGRPNRGEHLSVSANKYTRIFTDAIIDDLSVVARKLHGSERELFWTLASSNVAKSMISFCTSHNGFDYGIEKDVRSKINLKQLLG